MNKYKLYFCMSIILILTTLIPLDVFAAKERIYDEAKLLTNAEKKSLELKAEKLSGKRKTDFMIVTITEDTAEDIEIYLQDLYDNEQLGYDQPHGNVAILGIDIDRRDVIIVGFKKAEERLAASRLDSIRDEITPNLSAENYADAFEKYLQLASDYIRFKPGANPENIMYKTSAQLIFSLIVAIGIVGMMVRRINPKVTTTAATYRDESRTKINSKRDRYLRKTVTKRRKPRNNSSSGGSGSSRSVGRTSGGRSYSRSRGKF